MKKKHTLINANKNVSVRRYREISMEKSITTSQSFKHVLHHSATGIILLVLVSLFSCEKNFDINIKANEPQLVVEGYINNVIPEYNYIVLSRSQDYYAPDFQSIAVTNATVTVTEGTLSPDHTYMWDNNSKVQLTEAGLPQLPANFRKGVYFDRRLLTNPAQALKGVPGRYYLLEIETGGSQYNAVAAMLPIVEIDSLTSGYNFIDAEDSNKAKARITIHYKDPDTIGNAQLSYWRFRENRSNFGWGGLNSSRRVNRTDDLNNGEYIHFTQPQGFEVGDTVNYYMANVERKVYNFWDSYYKARGNDGPFSTPVTLLNTIQGNNVTGCFSGLSMSTKTIIIK